MQNFPFRENSTADACYFTGGLPRQNVAEPAARAIPALSADNGMRGRDERFKSRERHKAKPDPLHNKQSPRTARHYRPQDFHHDEAAGACRCPAGKANQDDFDPVERMQAAIDSDAGRALYGQRFATVEPVFDNLRANKKWNRFTLRGQAKVDTQWKLLCLVHNIEKLAHHG